MKLNIKELILFSHLATIMFLFKELLSIFPNIELVSFFVILFAINYKYKSLFIISIYLALIGLIDGFNIWFIPYILTWFCICLISILLANKIKNSKIILAIYSSLCGLFFSIIYTLSNFILIGYASGISYFLLGLPFDFIHMISNFIIMFLLWPRTSLLIKKLNLKFKI